MRRRANIYNPVFGFFEPWKKIGSSTTGSGEQRGSGNRSLEAPMSSSCA